MHLYTTKTVYSARVQTQKNQMLKNFRSVVA